MARRSEETMTLREQFNAKVAAAKTAAEAGNVEESTRLRGEAEALLAQANALKAADGLAGSFPEPMRPVLPGTGDGVTPQAPAATNPAAKAAYATRFGDQDAAVKAILVDLHGEDYTGQYWRQKAAFSRYLRRGERGFKSGDEELLRQIIMTPAAVRDALMQGVDSVAELKAVMVEGSDTLGGYLVPIDFQTDVIARLRAATVVRARANVKGTSRDTVGIPKITGGTSQYRSAVRVTWVSETPTAGAGATNLTFGFEQMPIHTVMAETFLSRNDIEDAAFDIVGYLAEEFANAADIDEDNQFLTGDGNGRPRGILPSSTNALSLTEVVSGDASLLTWDGLIGLTYGIDAQYRQNAAWIAAKSTYMAIAKLKDGDGQYLWREMYGNNVAGQARQLLGYPVREQEGMPAVAANAYPIVFGDLRGYYIRDRVGMSVERYLDSSTARINQVVYVMRRRLGGQAAESWRFAVQKVAAS